jgi:hypothetical protein
MDDSDFIKMAQRLRPRTVAEIAEKLNHCISNNIMNQIEMFLGTFQFNQDSKNEWFFDYGGMEAVKRWRGFHGHEDIEKENFPKAYNFKQDCLYYLDNYEQSRGLNSESEFIQNEDVQEAEIPPEPAQDTQTPEVPAFLKKWIDAGQVITNDKGEYVTAGSPEKFCGWIKIQFDSYATEIPPVETTAKVLKNPIKLETWKDYYKRAGILKKPSRKNETV